MSTVPLGQTVTLSTPAADCYDVTGGTLIVAAGGSVTAGPATGLGSSAVTLDSGAVEVQGGSVTGGVVTGGSGSDAVAINAGTFTMTAGAVTGGQGIIGGAGISTNGGDLTISGGTVTGGPGTGGAGGPSLRLEGATLVVNGGTFDCGAGLSGPSNAFTLQDATVKLYAGTFSPSGGTSLILVGESRVDVYGGTFGGPWELHGSCTLRVHGTGLVLGRTHLTGTLSDGTPINVAVTAGASAQIKLVQ